MFRSPLPNDFPRLFVNPYDFVHPTDGQYNVAVRKYIDGIGVSPYLSITEWAFYIFFGIEVIEIVPLPNSGPLLPVEEF